MTQSLQRKSLTVCEACGSSVYFRFRSSVATDDPRVRRVYLTCPCCGASATQLQDVEELPKRPRAHVRYVYQS